MSLRLIQSLFAHIALAVLVLMLSAFSDLANAQLCDVDLDGDVDRLDLASIFSNRNLPASGADDPADFDQSGFVTVLDGRACALQCDAPQCDVVVPTLELSITEPAEGAFLNQLSVIVRGTVSHPDARVLVQGQAAEVTDETFQAQISLFEGPNDITVEARSPAGSEATASRTVTVDTIPPALAVSSPPDRSVATESPVNITGTVFDANPLTCSINGDAATVDQGTLEGTVILAEGANVITVNCEDAAANVSEVQRTIYLDGSPIQVTSVDPPDGALEVPGINPVTVTFSEAVDPTSVSATSIYLSAGAAILPVDVVVSQADLTATMTPITPLPSGLSVSINVTTGVTNADGVPLPVPFSSGFTIAGVLDEAGIAIGQVFDDPRGMPVANATVDAISLSDGSPLASGVTDERGRYLLVPGQSDIVIRVSAPGFTDADRLPGPSVGTFVDVLDARITPLAEPTTIEAVLGGEISNKAENLLRIPPGGVSTDSAIGFTAISEQGPRAPFPMGWTPLGIVAIDSPAPFNLPAIVIFNNLDENLAGRSAVFAVYDLVSTSWIAKETLALTDSGTVEVGGITGSGQFALVVPDTGDGAPVAVLPSQALTAGTAPPIPENAIASGNVEPSVGRADDPTPAAATVTVSADEILRSGSVIRGDFMEVFLLRDGDRITPFDRSQDLIVYRSPEIAASEMLLAANFPVAPSQTFGLAELSEGTVTVSLLRDDAVATNIIGPSGGGIQIDDGSRVTISSGSLTSDTPVNLRRIGESSFPAIDTPTIAFIGGLELDLSGAQTSAAVKLSLGNAAALVATGSQVIVAETRTIRDRQRLVLVAVGIIQGDSITTATMFGNTTLPGIRNSGRYGFYRFDGNLNAVEGTARDEAGRRDGHIIEIEALPFVSITDANGAFALVAQPGDFTVIATGAEIADQVRVAGITTTPLDEIIITATPPEVESVTVRRPRIAGIFVGPLALLGQPPPVIDDLAGGNGNGQIEAGEAIALSISVRNEGTVEMEAGAFALQIDAPAGQVVVTPASITFDALPPNVPFTVGPFSYTVPIDVNPARLRYTLLHSSVAGLSTLIPFDLPLGVDHPNVPVDSEISIRFSEPVDTDSLSGAITLEQEVDGSLILVATNLVISNDSIETTLRPLATLADDTVFHLTLNDSIVDSDGRALADAPVVQTLRTEDITPPASIAPGQIEASFPDAEGFITITASPGTVNPDDIVIILNQTTGVSVLATVSPDGSFTARIQAESTDLISIIVRDRNNNETTIDIESLVDRDPVTGEIISTIIGRRGGTVSGPDNIQLTVPAGAVAGATELAVTPNTDEFTLPADLLADPAVVDAFNALFTPADRVQLDASITSFAGPIELTLPAPPGSAIGDLYLLVRNRMVTIGGPLADIDRVTGIPRDENPVRAVERLEIIETASVKDDGGVLILSTDSPPFNGITEPDLMTYLKVNGILTFLAGQVRRDELTGPLVADAIVTSLRDALATSPFAAVTDDDGQFVVADANAGGPYQDGDEVSSRLDVRDPNFDRVIRRDVRGIVGPPAPPLTIVAQLEEPFVLPIHLPADIIDILGDLEPPDVELLIEPLFFGGDYARLAITLNITVEAEDNDQVEFIALEVDQGFGFTFLSPGPTGTFKFAPLSVGMITFRGQARDPSGNITFKERIVRAFTGIAPGPLVGQGPVVVGPLGQPGQLVEITFDADIEIPFSEPIDPETIGPDTVELVDLDENPVVADFSLERSDTLLRIRPRRNLRLGASYTAALSAEIRDLNGEPFAGESFISTVLQPVLSQIDCQNTPDEDGQCDAPLTNVEDVALFGDAVLAINHPDGTSIGDEGWLHVFKVDLNTENQFTGFQNLSTTQVVGRPLSLAVDGDRVYIGNRFLGPIATKEVLLTFSIPTLSSDGTPDINLGCNVSDLIEPDPVCAGLLFVDKTFPRPPSNLQAFSLRDPENPERLGAVVTNRLPPDVWEPNTWPHEVAITDQGIAVHSFSQNLEIFRPLLVPEPPGFPAETEGVVGWIPGYAEFLGRCQGGSRNGQICVIAPVPTDEFQRLSCPVGTCVEKTEFLDMGFFDGFAVSTERDGLRILSTAPETLNAGILPSLYNEQTIRLEKSVGGPGTAVGAVPEFEWIDENDQIRIVDLAFLTSRQAGLTILDVTEPSIPRVLYPNPFADQAAAPKILSRNNMSVDPCRGVAYLHGQNGEFHVVDFNDPSAPIELNRPDPGQPPFRIDQLGPRASFNGNTNKDRVVYLAGETGVGVVDTRGRSPTAASATNRCTALENGVRVASISFTGGNHAVDIPIVIAATPNSHTDFTGTPISNPVWEDTNGNGTIDNTEPNYPVVYSQGSSPVLEATIDVVNPDVVDLSAARIRAKLVGFGFMLRYSQLSTPVGNIVQLLTTDRIPDGIDLVGATITWEISPDERQTFVPFQLTSHELIVTLDKPVDPNRTDLNAPTIRRLKTSVEAMLRKTSDETAALAAFDWLKRPRVEFNSGAGVCRFGANRAWELLDGTIADNAGDCFTLAVLMSAMIRQVGGSADKRELYATTNADHFNPQKNPEETATLKFVTGGSNPQNFEAVAEAGGRFYAVTLFHCKKAIDVLRWFICPNTFSSESYQAFFFDDGSGRASSQPEDLPTDWEICPTNVSGEPIAFVNLPAGCQQ